MSSPDIRVQELFERVVEIPPDEREHWLISHCDDENIRNEVRSLLMYINADAVSDSEAFDDLAPDDLTGSQLDRYAILQRIGEGGFSDIYLAQQQQPVQRRVAIKVVKIGSPRVAERFQIERQTLALMDHPSIATIFDGGSTSDGRFYLVMEFVDGEQITNYCNIHQLSIDERLDLFEQLCTAVQHAHTKGVIHRDLKPGNILVTVRDEKPLIKIIDFGIARLLEPHDQAEASQGISGTPQYMSPEQTRPNEATADTRSDVYSLGLILYEILTGQLPFTPETLSSRVVEPVFDSHVPTLPSLACGKGHSDNVASAARSRQLNPARLATRLRGDLDRIVMRCLELDPDDRYATPAELASDITRYLTNQPISAGPDRFSYHLGKLLSRHRIAASIGLLFFLLAVFGFFVVFELRARSFEAHERANAFRVYIQSMISTIDPETAKFRDRKIMQSMLHSASSEIDETFDAYPKIAIELYMDFGQAYERIGTYDDALSHYQAAENLASHHLPSHSANRVQAIMMLGNGHLKSGDFNQALEILQEASQLADAELGPRHPYTIEADRYRGIALNALGRHDEALACHISVLQRYEETLGNQAEDTLQSRCDMAVALIKVGQINAAAQHLTEVVEQCPQSLGINHPLNAGARTDLAVAYGHLGHLEKSETLEREALLMREKILGTEHPDTLTVMANLGTTLELMDRSEEALLLHNKALLGRQNVLGPDHPDTVNSMINMAITLGLLERYEEAEGYERKALEILERTLGNEHPETLITKSNLAVTLGLRGDLQEEANLEEEVLEAQRRLLGSKNPNTLMAIFNLSCTLRDIGRLDEAEPLAIEAYEGYRQHYGEGDPETIDCIDELIELYTKQNSPKDVKAWEHTKAMALASTNTGRPTAGTARSMPVP